MSLVLKGKPSLSVLASVLNLFPNSACQITPQVIRAIQSNDHDTNSLRAIIYSCSHIDVKSSASILPHLTAFIDSRSSPATISRYLISAAKTRTTFADKERLRELLSTIDLGQLDSRTIRYLFHACVVLGIAERTDVARFCRLLVATYHEIEPSHFARFIWQSARVKGVSYEDISPFMQLLKASKVNLSNSDLRLVGSSVKTLVNGRYWYRCLFDRALKSLLDVGVPHWETVAVITSAVRAQAYDHVVLSSLSPSLLKQLPDLKANERLQLVWAYAAASQYDSELFTATAKLDAAIINTFTPGSVSVFIWAFTKVAHFADSDRIYESVLEYCESRNGDFTLKELCTVVLSLATYSFLTDKALISRRVAELWQLAVHRTLSIEFPVDNTGRQVLRMLDQARLALIHNGCILDHDLAENIVTLAHPPAPSSKKAFIRDLIIESLREAGFGDEIRLDARCERSGIAVSLAVSKIAIECFLRNDFVDGLQIQLNASNLLCCKLLQRNGWKVAVISERELLQCKEPPDRLRLLLDKLSV